MRTSPSSAYPAIVAINKFETDTEAELKMVAEKAAALGAKAVLCSHWADGSAGTEALASEVVRVAEEGKSDFRPLVRGRRVSLWEKVETVAREIYRADAVSAPAAVKAQFAELQEGLRLAPGLHGEDSIFVLVRPPHSRARPSGHELTVRELRLSAGAGFVVVVCGDIMTIARTAAQPRRRGDSSG